MRPAAPGSHRPERAGSGGAGVGAAGVAPPAPSPSAPLRGRSPTGQSLVSASSAGGVSRAEPGAGCPGRIPPPEPRSERGSAYAQLIALRPRQRHSGRRALMNIYSERRRAPPPSPAPPISRARAGSGGPAPALLKVEPAPWPWRGGRSLVPAAVGDVAVFFPCCVRAPDRTERCSSRPPSALPAACAAAGNHRSGLLQGAAFPLQRLPVQIGPLAGAAVLPRLSGNRCLFWVFFWSNRWCSRDTSRPMPPGARQALASSRRFSAPGTTMLRPRLNGPRCTCG